MELKRHRRVESQVDLNHSSTYAFFGVLIFHSNLHYGVNPSVLAPLKLWWNESSTGGSRENQSSHSLLSISSPGLRVAQEHRQMSPTANPIAISPHSSLALAESV